MAKKKRDAAELEAQTQETETQIANGDTHESKTKKMKKKKRDEPALEAQTQEIETQIANGDTHELKTKKMKKKKIDEPEFEAETQFVNGDAHEAKTKKKKKNKRDSDIDEPKEKPTVTIAVPGSIIDNAQSFELATRLAGQIARAATIFRIDEIVVFDNSSTSEDDPSVTSANNSNEKESGAAFLIRILRYLETPQYLRKNLFPRHNSLRCVGLLPPLDAPHHLRKHEWASYREGVTLKEQAPNSSLTLVDVGLSKSVVIDQVLEPGIRVTVAMGADRNLNSDPPHQVVSSSKPLEEAGMYWGYKVRYAPNISSVLNNSTFKGGYDYLIGTSEHGLTLKSSELALPSFRHLLIAFGGLAGLEECIEEDNQLKGKKAKEIFDTYLNTCPQQGSRTIRSEEAIFISLQYFQEPIHRAIDDIKIT